MQAMPSAAPDALFPAIEPYAHGFLPEQDGHTVYFEQCGNPAGLPLVFVHGGPGSGAMPRHRQFFDPHSTRAILWDQRGFGRSRADRPLLPNTTAHLIPALERIRAALGLRAGGDKKPAGPREGPAARAPMHKHQGKACGVAALLEIHRVAVLLGQEAVRVGLNGGKQGVWRGGWHGLHAMPF